MMSLLLSGCGTSTVFDSVTMQDMVHWRFKARPVKDVILGTQQGDSLKMELNLYKFRCFTQWHHIKRSSNWSEFTVFIISLKRHC